MAWTGVVVGTGVVLALADVRPVAMATVNAAVWVVAVVIGIVTTDRAGVQPD